MVVSDPWFLGILFSMGFRYMEMRIFVRVQKGLWGVVVSDPWFLGILFSMGFSHMEMRIFVRVRKGL